MGASARSRVSLFHRIARSRSRRSAAALCLLVAACHDAPTAAVPLAPIPVAGDAATAMRALGRGVNFGNLLEAPTEGAWGLRLSEALFDAAKTAGATSIRLPVRWSAHALTTAPYGIDAAFFARVDYAVAAAQARGLGIVIDMHHYHQLDGDALDAGEALVAPNEVEARFVAMWRQIALRYGTQPTSVLFELYNEPHSDLTSARWNALLATTLRAVREIDTTRYIVIGPTQWNSASRLSELELPSVDQRLIVTIHNYEPFGFTHQGADWVGLQNSPTVTCCTTSQVAQLVAPLDVAHQWSATAQRPVFVGEFGSYGAGPYPSRVIWTRTIRDAIEARGMSFAYWEFAAGFGFFDVATGAWKPELRDALLH
jgi:endoglucanase